LFLGYLDKKSTVNYYLILVYTVFFVNLLKI